jgi:hypothetical protein
MFKDLTGAPALGEKDKGSDEPGPIHACLTADQDLVSRLPTPGCVGSDLAKSVEVIRIELGIREPIPDLLNAPRRWLRVRVERDDEIEGTLPAIVADFGWHPKVAGFAGPALPETGQDLGRGCVGPAW